MKMARENRTLLFTDLPATIGGFRNDLTEIRVSLNYVEGPNEGNRLSKALILDELILPAIVRALEEGEETS